MPCASHRNKVRLALSFMASKNPSTTPPDWPRLMSLTEVLEVVPVTRVTLIKLIEDGDLVGYKIRGRYSVAESDLVAFLDRTRTDSRFGCTSKPPGQVVA